MNNISSEVSNNGIKSELAISESSELSQVWTYFNKRLAETLSSLKEDSFLILSKKNSGEFIQFSSQGAFGLRCETVSNYFRADNNQLSEQQIHQLALLGWHSPTRDPENSTPENDPLGSPNFYLEFLLPVNFDNVADFIASTFTSVLGIKHPAFLQYESFDGAGASLSLPQLGLKREISTIEINDGLPTLVLNTIKELTGIDDWHYDDANCITGIHYGLASTSVMLLEDHSYLRMLSVILEEVEPSLHLFRRINEINFENGFMHLVFQDCAVLALSDIQTCPFISSHVAHALGNFTQRVNEIKTNLDAEFADGEASCNQHQVPPTH